MELFSGLKGLVRWSSETRNVEQLEHGQRNVIDSAR